VNLVELKDRLKELRTKKGLYQKELAERLGVGRSTVAAWETGSKRPEGRTLEQIADLFSVSVDYLLGRTDDLQGTYIEDTTGDTRQVIALEVMAQDKPARDLIVFLRGKKLTNDDVEAVKDLLEARRLRREREEREKNQP
jgi:transcriptional regulator with XRE-family HTH domain